MPSEKAKENKQLVATCEACGKQMSVELLTGLIVGRGRQRRSVAVCEPCLAKGWLPGDNTAPKP